MSIENFSRSAIGVHETRRMFIKATMATSAAATLGTLSAGGTKAAFAATTDLPAAKGSTATWDAVPVPEQVPVKEGLAELKEAKLWYWDTGGDGVPVIFLHAGSQSAAGWGYQQPAFARAGYRVIGYSRRGYYKSDPGDVKNPGVASEDLHELISYLNLGKKVHLVSIAHGAYFALDYVLTHPENVRSLSVISSMMGIKDQDYRELDARLRPKFFNDLPVEFKELGPSYRAGNPNGLAEWKRLASEARPGGRVTPRLANDMNWRALESITTPTLLMTGEADLFTPPSLLRMQASHMPGAEVHVVPEAGHCANWEQPDAFNKIVLSFLAKH